MKVLAWYIDLNGIKNKYILKPTQQYFLKGQKILIMNTPVVSTKGDTSLTQVVTSFLPKPFKKKARCPASSFSSYITRLLLCRRNHKIQKG
jgi:hypothetical protein